jgi:serine/threonine protein kinase
MVQDEARINAELQHENIAQVYDFGRVGDEFFLAMEYVPGIDLRQVQQALARRGERLPLGMSLRVLCDVLSGLEYAHSRVDTYGRPMRNVHRDINPRNIMLSVRGEVKIIDFGVA